MCMLKIYYLRFGGISPDILPSQLSGHVVYLSECLWVLVLLLMHQHDEQTDLKVQHTRLEGVGGCSDYF